MFSGDFDPELQEAESLATIARGLALGINFLDTAWIYQVRFLKAIFSG
jgi:aryl-alcohol dehydrogenase-like predicted oxidoreductase